MFDAAVAIGPGYKFPTYHDLRLPLLKDSRKRTSIVVDNIRNIWVDCGCTIMGDDWTDNSDRTLINFLIYCPRGTIFWKSVDASDVVKDAQALLSYFKKLLSGQEESFLNYEEIDHVLYEQLDPPRMERQRRHPREDDVDAIENIELVEDLEVDDDMDFSAFEKFNVDGNLHDISIGVGEGCSNSGGVIYGENEEWLRRV
ncbi:hypothetical protein Sango_0816900 [Sesamum angolense]|uniref:DUF659 domain-containing protein n=1 Tax=Sesamum angolense TaxID=2727404 RepID=A0AAE1X394_9LAMI|nr:hypothetical protein Sango_0816900 [Sesamum angolense]